MASEARNNSYTNLADPNRPSEWLEKQQSGTRKSKFLVCSFSAFVLFAPKREWVGCWGMSWHPAKF